MSDTSRLPRAPVAFRLAAARRGQAIATRGGQGQRVRAIRAADFFNCIGGHVVQLHRESRRLNYKNKGQFRQDELKKKREEQQVEIRKQKREESIAKRRNLATPQGGTGDSDEDEAVATQLDSQVC